MDEIRLGRDTCHMPSSCSSPLSSKAFCPVQKSLFDLEDRKKRNRLVTVSTSNELHFQLYHAIFKKALSMAEDTKEHFYSHVVTS